MGCSFMSKLLDELVSDRISLAECLERLLVIANKINNIELANWCTLELTGYSKEQLPDYRKFVSKHITYAGISGLYKITDAPIQAGYLSNETIDKVSKVHLFENIYDVIKRKDQKEGMIRDLTMLAPEVYQNTCDDFYGVGVQCTSIKQLIPAEFYSKIYSAVKIRVINTLCALEEAKVKIDNADVKNAIKVINFKKENKELYKTIIVDGQPYSINKKEHKWLWNLIVPIVTTILGSLISAIVTYYLAK